MESESTPRNTSIFCHPQPMMLLGLTPDGCPQCKSWPSSARVVSLILAGKEGHVCRYWCLGGCCGFCRFWWLFGNISNTVLLKASDDVSSSLQDSSFVFLCVLMGAAQLSTNRHYFWLVAVFVTRRRAKTTGPNPTLNHH